MSFDPAAFFSRDVVSIAADLIGASLLFDGCGGLIVETEAYHPDEPASHSFRGPTPANAAMFLGPGHLYVYRSYGLHWCVNFVCAGNAAVLVRAIEPRQGLAQMRARRGVEETRSLCSGPGRLTMALGIDRRLDGVPLADSGLGLTLPDQPQARLVGPRIGISKAVDLPWRFGLAGSRFLSRSFPKAT